MIIEWNQHLWHRDTETYPFHPRARYHPHHDKRYDDPLAQYERRMEEHDIDRAVIVHPEPYGDDHRLVMECVAEDPDRFRAVSLFYPDDPEAPEKLRELVDEHGTLVAATRFHTFDWYMDRLTDDGVKAIWETASDLDLIVELHLTPPHATGAAEMIEAYPDTPVVLDHFAEPQQGNPVDYANVLDLAEYENVYMKLSGLSHFANDPPLHKAVRPFTRRVVEAFGPDRMLWGSGQPETVDAHLPEYSAEDREKVKGDNARALVWED